MKGLGNYIKKVQAKSEAEKKQTVVVWTITLTSLIFIIWVITFSLSVVNNQVEEVRLREAATAKAQATQFEPVGTSTTLAVSKQNNSWGTKLSKFIAEGADSISTGFWAISNWLHPSP